MATTARNKPLRAAGRRWSLLAILDAWISRNIPRVFPAPAVLAMAILLLLPLCYTLYLSFHQWYVSNLTSPKFVWFANYAALVTKDGRFWPAVFRTLYFTAASVILATAAGLGVAHVLVREFPGRGAARTLILLPMIATPVAMALVWTIMMSPTLGVLNYLLRGLGLPPALWLASERGVIPSLLLVETWMWTPMTALICLAGLASLPLEPFESARVDGATGWQTFWFITLPLMRSTLVVAALFRMIDALKVFDTIYVMTEGGPGFASETLNIYVFQTSFKYLNMGYASALIMLFFALVLGASVLLLSARRAEPATS